MVVSTSAEQSHRASPQLRGTDSPPAPSIPGRSPDCLAPGCVKSSPPVMTALTVLSSSPRAIVDAAATYQVDVQALLRDPGIARGAVETPGGRVPEAAAARLWALAVAATGDPCLGLVVAQQYMPIRDPDALGPVPDADGLRTSRGGVPPRRARTALHINDEAAAITLRINRTVPKIQ